MTAPQINGAGIHLSWRKKLLFSVVVQLCALTLLECAARVGSYLYHGRNPYYLFFGFVSATDDDGGGHSEKYSGYYKFPANDLIEYGTPEPARINNHGFRGPDFEVQKPDGTRRVVCLGASSTFGYLNRDAGTYPVLLEGLLARAATEAPVEVINAGIPHFNTDNILAILRGEVLQLGPDVLTLYTGYNDAVFPLATSPLQEISSWLDEYSALFASVRKLINSTAGPIIFGQWSPYLPRMTREEVERQVALHGARTRENLEQIIAASRTAGASLVLIRQPVTMWPVRVERGLADREQPRPTYEEEFADIARTLAETGHLASFEVTVFVHHHLLDLMDELAAENGLALVDNVALIAEHPSGMGSKVHLHEDANARLAAALAPVVLGLLED